MKEIIFCTTNKKKLESINNFLQEYKIHATGYDLDIPESRSLCNIEISKDKVQQAYSIINKPVIAIDSGIYIESLNGFPATFVNFVLQTIGITGITELVNNKNKNCEIRNSLAFKSDNDDIVFTETIKGHLSNNPIGELSAYNWSEFHKVFIPEGYTQTLAEMSEEDYKLWDQKRIINGYLEKFAKYFINK